MMNRRNFLVSTLASGVAPAFVKSDSLMGLWVPSNGIVNGSGFSSELVDVYDEPFSECDLVQFGESKIEVFGDWPVQTLTASYN